MFSISQDLTLQGISGISQHFYCVSINPQHNIFLIKLFLNCFYKNKCQVQTHWLAQRHFSLRRSGISWPFFPFFFYFFFFFNFLSLFQPGIWGTRLFVRQGFCLRWNVPGLPNERLWNGLPEGSPSQLTLLQEWEWLCCGWPGRMDTQQCRILRHCSQLESPPDWANPKGVLILLGRNVGLASLPASGKRDLLVAGEGFVPKPLWCGSALGQSCPDQEGAGGDTLEVRVILNLLQWQHEFNQTPNLRSMDIISCHLSFSSLLVLCSLSISRNPFRLCVLRAALYFSWQVFVWVLIWSNAQCHSQSCC